MDTKNEITREEFDAIQAEYEDALKKRRITMLRQRKGGMTQQAIADYWGRDIALVNRAVNAQPKKKVRTNESL